MAFDLEEGCAVLARTPAVLDVWLRGLPEPWLRATEGPDTWSPFDVVGHLIDGEERDWLPRARLILSEAPAPAKRFEPVDRFRHLGRNAGRPLEALLDEFATLRAANLAELRGWRLGPAELARTGEHPALGTVTLEQLLSTWVVHDLGHLAQVARVMAKRWGGEVGPWAAYLPVLTR